jgi:hypothetical protein
LKTWQWIYQQQKQYNIMAEEIVIGKLIIDNSDLDRAMVESKRAVIDLENEQKKLKKETDNLSGANEQQLKTFVANESSLKSARAEYSANQKTVLAITKAQNGLDDALKKNITTQYEAIENTKALTEARRKIDTTTVEGAKAIQDINGKINSNNKLINESSSALEQQKNNVGNYPTLMNAVSTSFGGAAQSIIGFTQQGKAAIGEITNTIGAYKSAQEANAVAQQVLTTAQAAQTQATNVAAVATERAAIIGFQRTQGLATDTEVEIANAAATTAQTQATAAQAVATNASTVATNTSTVATKSLRIAMLAIPLVAILALAVPIISFFASTQEGMDRITAVTRPLVAIFQSFIGVLQNVATKLVDTFTSPKKALNDFVDFFKQNLINRATAFLEILQGIINLDFRRVADGVAQAGTGVEGLSGKIEGAARNTAAFLKEAAERGKEIDRLTKDIEKAEIGLNKQTQENLSKRKELDKIVKDTSLNIKDRTKANEDQNKLAREQAALESGILEMKIKRLIVEQKLNDTNRKGNKELADLEAQSEVINQKLIDEELAGVGVIATARKEATAKAKENSDKAFQNSLKESRNKIDLIKAEAAQSDLSVEKRIENAKKVFDLENELAKKSSSGSDQQKLLLTNKQNLSVELLAIAEEQINSEIEAQKKLFTENKKITQDQFDKQIQSANDLANAQILLLNKSLLTEKAYADEVDKINKGKNESIILANTSFEEGEKIRKETQLENERALAATAFEIRLLTLEEQGVIENDLKLERLTEQYRLEQELLDEKYENNLISDELYAEKKLLAEKKFSSEVRKNDKILTAQKRANNIDMAKDSIGAMQSVFGESKALSLAMALVNTYEGITAGVKLGYPKAIPAVAMAAATGFAAVKNILSTNKNSSAPSGGGAPQTTTGSGSFQNTAKTSTIATVSERPLEQNTVVTPPVLILETLQERQNEVAIKIGSN